MKEKFNQHFVVIYKQRYFAIDFDDRKIKEITFEEAYGCGFFDWDNNICIATDYQKKKYDEMRGKDGTGFGEICKIVYKDLEREYGIL